MSNSSDQLIDPDPFTIAIGLTSVLIAGATFLETHRRNQQMQARERATLEARFFRAQRALIRVDELVHEFESHMMENRFGDWPVEYGRGRLNVDKRRAVGLRRFITRLSEAVGPMTTALDLLSDYLSADYQPLIARIDGRARGLFEQQSYESLVVLAGVIVEYYADLLDAVNRQNGFMSGSVADRLRSGRMR